MALIFKRIKLKRPFSYVILFYFDSRKAPVQLKNWNMV